MITNRLNTTTRDLINIGLVCSASLLLSCSVAQKILSSKNSLQKTDSTTVIRIQDSISMDSTKIINYRDSIFTFLQNVDSLKLYAMHPPIKQTVDSIKYDSIGTYIVDYEIGKIKKEDGNILLFILTDDRTLTEDYLPIKQPFYPYISIKAFCNEKIMNLFFSYGSHELGINFGGKKIKTFKIQDIRSVARWTNIILPNDEYIKCIINN